MSQYQRRLAAGDNDVCPGAGIIAIVQYFAHDAFEGSGTQCRDCVRTPLRYIGGVIDGYQG